MKFENIRVYNFENALRGMRNPKESWGKSDSLYGLGTWDNAVEAAVEILDKYNYNKDFGYSTINSRQLEDFMYDVVIYTSNDYCEYAAIGPEDMRLAQNLIRAGSEHRKFMRQIFVSVDITAPLYFWKELDTYKVATVANSTSTMHTIQNKEIDFGLFELGDYHSELPLIDDVNLGLRVDCFLNDLEQLRQKYLMLMDKAKQTNSEEKAEAIRKEAKLYWKELIRWLPEGWLQTRTWTGNYENLLGICSKGQRRYHKLTEWSGEYPDEEEIKSFIEFARSLPYAKDFIFLDELNKED